MKSIAVCCGMPRSGTTLVCQSITAKFIVPSSSPEESRFLSSPELIVKFHEFASTLYRKTLIEYGPDGPYSAWGSEDYFVGQLAATFPNLVSALSHRDFIESGTINGEYVRLINKIRSSLFSISQEPNLVLKQPNAELAHHEINAIFSDRKVVYVICLRNPFDVYCSLRALGWTEGLGQFLAELTDSYKSSLEIVRKGQGIVQLVGFDFHNFGDTVEFLQREGRMKIRETELVTDKHWINKGISVEKSHSSDEFNYYFVSSGALALFEELKNSSANVKS